MSTRYSCHRRVVVGQRCHRIVSLLRLALTGYDIYVMLYQVCCRLTRSFICSRKEAGPNT